MTSTRPANQRPRLRFRPSWGATLAALPVFLVLVGLGLWQLERLEWKTELLTRIERGLAAEPTDFPAAIADPAAWEYRRVRVQGVYLDIPPQRLLARLHEGQLGVQLVNPLRLDDGRVLFVNRGWIPVERQDAPPPPPVGPVTVEGILRRPPDEPGWMRPENRPARNEWFWFDLPGMAAATGIGAAPVAPIVLEAAEDGEDGLPVGGQTIVTLPNNHLEYALTWFGLAAALVGIFIASQRRPAP